MRTLQALVVPLAPATASANVRGAVTSPATPSLECVSRYNRGSNTHDMTTGQIR
jgi:hypothetical protein